MTNLITRLKTFSIKEEGAALVEYAVILGLVVVVGAAALTNLGTAAQDKIEAAESVLS